MTERPLDSEETSEKTALEARLYTGPYKLYHAEETVNVGAPVRSLRPISTFTLTLPLTLRSTRKIRRRVKSVRPLANTNLNVGQQYD